MARADWKLLHALTNLAYRLVLHFVRRLSPFARRPGLQEFEDNYVPEGLPPATERRRTLTPQASQCTACAICDTVCPLLVDGTAPRFVGPMGFVLSGFRAAPYYPDIRADLTTLTGTGCGSCRRCERACPERIAILSLAALAASELDVIDRSRRALVERSA